MRDDLSFDSIRIGVLRFWKSGIHFCNVIFNVMCFFMIDALSFLTQFSELFVLKKELTASEYILIVDLILRSTSI